MSLFQHFGHQDDQAVKNLNAQFEKAAEPLRDLESEYKQMKYFTKTGCSIEPVAEYFPGVSYCQRHDSASGIVKQTAVPDSFQYIPLRPLLKKVLETPGTMKKIIDYQNTEHDAGVLQDFHDGELYKHNFLFSKELSIPLLLYNDDCETVNPLGSKTIVHKLGLIYFQIKCLPPMLLSSLSSCFLLAVYKSDDAKTYGIDSVLQRITDDIMDLEVRGLLIDTPEFCGTVKISVAQVCGDNLGLNSLLGYSESFTANHCCRWCKVHKEDMWSQTVEDPEMLRNAQNYAKDLASNNHSETGIKRKCVLDELKYFSVVDNVAPDIMHDILEGIGPFEVKLVLASLVAEGHVSLETLNYRLTSFDYGFPDSSNKPSVLGQHELKKPNGAMRQTAAQMWCFLRFLPIIIGDKIPKGNKHWELLLLLLTCMEFIFSPSITAEATIYLKHLIAEHHTVFLQLHPHLHLKPKHHFLLHYPRAIRKIGPLKQFWTMRFEARHNFFKQLSHIVCNFKNMCKTMAFRNQMMLCYRLLTESIFSKNTEFGPGHGSFLAAIQGEFVKGLEEAPFAEVFVPDWVVVNGTEYRPDMTVSMGCTEDGVPQFGLIKAIVTIGLNVDVKLVVKKWHTVGFDRHYFSYAVSPDEALEAVSVNSLHDFQPLHAVKSYNAEDDLYYIPLRYRHF